MADPVLEQAIAWRIRLVEADGQTWDEFVSWLGESPTHGRVYDEVAMAEKDASDQLRLATTIPVPANDQPTKSGLRLWLGLGGAIAASLLGLVTVPHLRADIYELRTAPGEQREVALGEGSHMRLNGGTRVKLDRNDPRYAALESGEARFTIRHDAIRPFRLHVGNDIVEDAGTVFDVTREERGTRVEVAEGSVLYNPAGERVALGAGEALFDPADGQPIRIARRAPESIGGWAEGRLSYEEESVARVTADLARTLGVVIELAPALENRSFSGTIKVGSDRSEALERAATLLDVNIERTSRGWRFVPRPSESR